MNFTDVGVAVTEIVISVGFALPAVGLGIWLSKRTSIFNAMLTAVLAARLFQATFEKYLLQILGIQ